MFNQSTKWNHIKIFQTPVICGLKTGYKLVVGGGKNSWTLRKKLEFKSCIL